TSSPLRDELEHWNEVTSMRYQQFLEAVTALELEDANRHLTLFASMLDSNMSFITQRLDDIKNDTTKDEPDGIKMIRADHMILGRTCKMVEEALLQLINLADPATLRSEMVLRLDIFVRLNNILRQHQLRQHDSLFPLLELAIDTEKERSLTDLLTKAMQRSRPH
ncbi:MAG: hypothetical protein KTR32_36625, partial [Granulosicoccus sp.]|nr:hypothetical protein [Granulosicoccus sp.]